MNRNKSIYSILVIMWTLSLCALEPSNNELITAKLYDSFFKSGEAQRAKLNLFLTQMPKGGDLHHHYSGSIYVETYLEWLQEKKWGIDVATLKIVPKPITTSTDSVLTVSDLLKNDVLYRKLLTLWSNKDYYNHCHEQVPPDSNFFYSFEYFKEISPLNHDLGLRILKDRAIKENVSYIETMIANVGVEAKNYYTAEEVNSLVSEFRDSIKQEQVNKLCQQIEGKLVRNVQFLGRVDLFNNNLTRSHRGIDDENFMMRFQTYAVRVRDPLQVYCELLSAYLACESNPLLVGVNIVAPENNSVALRDYTLHMQMFNYLKSKYPRVNRALHAGELTCGMVRPKNLQFHIKEALEIAGAQRIGHGIDISYEKDSLKTLEKIKNESAVEINLTSNEFILGVKGQDHPYIIYEAYGVPMVISTDDSAVSRNNLSKEYLLLASRYQPSYKKIKEYVFNSVKYSFLNEEEKRELHKRVLVKFSKFERDMAELSKKLTQ
ncbi:adenosine deaminase [Lentisphaera araneosa]|jgi:adenosine deaminase|nr:adenosine deaminase [Lentisphaera araneosa]